MSVAKKECVRATLASYDRAVTSVHAGICARPLRNGAVYGAELVWSVRAGQLEPGGHVTVAFGEG